MGNCATGFNTDLPRHLLVFFEQFFDEKINILDCYNYAHYYFDYWCIFHCDICITDY